MILSFTNIRLLVLINKDTTWPDHHQHKVYTLLAVVFFFIIFNFPNLIVILWDILDFKRLNVCHEFDPNSGYSTINMICTDIGKSFNTSKGKPSK